MLAKQGIEIPLERVNTVFFSQSIFERMLGLGRPRSSSRPGRRGSETFSNIRKPSAVQNEIYLQMEANENRKFDRIGAPRRRRRRRRRSPTQIEQLDDLRQRGVLTDAEFQAKKAELLDRM